MSRALRRAFNAYVKAQADYLAAYPVPGLQHDEAAFADADEALRKAEEHYAYRARLEPDAARKLTLANALQTTKRQLAGLQRQLRAAERGERRVALAVVEREFQLQLAERLPPGPQRERALARVPPVPVLTTDKNALLALIAEHESRIDKLQNACTITTPSPTGATPMARPSPVIQGKTVTLTQIGEKLGISAAAAGQRWVKANREAPGAVTWEMLRRADKRKAESEKLKARILTLAEKHAASVIAEKVGKTTRYVQQVLTRASKKAAPKKSAAE